MRFLMLMMVGLTSLPLKPMQHGRDVQMSPMSRSTGSGSAPGSRRGSFASTDLGSDSSVGGSRFQFDSGHGTNLQAFVQRLSGDSLDVLTTAVGEMSAEDQALSRRYLEALLSGQRGLVRQKLTEFVHGLFEENIIDQNGQAGLIQLSNDLFAGVGRDSALKVKLTHILSLLQGRSPAVIEEIGVEEPLLAGRAPERPGRQAARDARPSLQERVIQECDCCTCCCACGCCPDCMLKCCLLASFCCDDFCGDWCFCDTHSSAEDGNCFYRRRRQPQAGEVASCCEGNSQCYRVCMCTAKVIVCPICCAICCLSCGQAGRSGGSGGSFHLML